MGNLAFYQFAILAMFICTYVSCNTRNTFLLDRPSKIRYRKSHDKTVVSVTSVVKRYSMFIIVPNVPERTCSTDIRVIYNDITQMFRSPYQKQRLFVYRLFTQLFLSYNLE